jgi:GNAT superfamily N-acetyltransferase
VARSFAVRSGDPRDLDEAVRIDDDASQLYAQSGLPLTLSATDAFVVDEQARWLRSAQLGRLFFAVDEDGRRVGFAALDMVDGAPYLDQLSVRMSDMGGGAGRLLLRHAIAWADGHGDALWLTTYDHLRWNRPFYEGAGFVVVPDPQCGPGVRHHLEEQRQWLPAPEHRIAMRRALAR